MNRKHLSHRCTKTVWSTVFGGRQCRRAPWKDGFCKQHHPKTEDARRAARDAEWERKRAMMDYRYKTEEHEAFRVVLLVRLFEDLAVHWPAIVKTVPDATAPVEVVTRHIDAVLRHDRRRPVPPSS